MSDNSDHECEKCGRKFDSKKGLKVHKTKAHGGKAEAPKLRPEFGRETFATLIIVIILIAVAGFLLLNSTSPVSEEGEGPKEPSKNMETQSVKKQSVEIVVLPENETVNETSPG